VVSVPCARLRPQGAEAVPRQHLLRVPACYRLRYASQHERRRERLERQRYKLIRRMGGDGEHWPTRPPGMHRSRYSVLLDRLTAIDMAIDDELCAAMERGPLGQIWREYNEAVDAFAVATAVVQTPTTARIKNGARGSTLST
jgi:hypothetical protein